MGEYQKVRLACSHGPDLHFEGELVGEYSTQNRAGTKQRWTELRLWATPAGNWIAESVGVSMRDGEGEIREAKVIVPAPPSVQSPRGYVDSARMRNAAMDVWGWTTAAKALSRELGWDVAVRVIE